VVTGIFCLLLGVSACLRRNHPPARPDVPAGPSSGKSYVNYTYATQTTDPDGDAIFYQFDWGNGDTSDWSRFQTSGLTFVDTNSWNSNGQYTIRVRAKDHHEAISEWSEGLTLSIGNRPPEIPVIDSAPDTIWPGVTATLLFRAIDPDADSVTFILDFGSGDSVVTESLVPSNQFTRFRHAWANTGTFTFRVRARDSRGLLSDWSEPRTVSVPGPDLRWCFAAGRRITSSPAVAPDGTVLFGSEGDGFYALNPDGTSRWRYPLKSRVFDAPTIGGFGTVHFLTREGDFYSLYMDGTVSWRQHVGVGSSSSSRVATLSQGSVIYCPAGGLRAFDAQGNLVWRRGSGGAVAVGVDGTLYFVGDSVQAVHPDGTAYWSSAVFYGPNRSPPALGADGTIYWLDTHGALSAFNPEGSLRWTSPLDGTYPLTSPVIGPNGTIYCGAKRGLYAVGPDGNVKWHFATPDEIRSTAAVAADGTIIFGCDDHMLYALDPNGSLLWARGTGGHVRTSPTIAPDGTIYFGSSDHCLYALAGTSPLADSPWPMFHHDPQHTGRAR